MATNHHEVERKSLIHKLRNVPQRVLLQVIGIIDDMLHQSFVKRKWDSLQIAPDVLDEIESSLLHILSQKKQQRTSPLTLAPHERRLVEQLIRETKRQNLNNMTRTNAYWEMYKQAPEVHWAYLAHMVSRNGGWSMTDLKADLLPHLLDKNKIHLFFLFLETCNAYIFQDAYPQLLLYLESRKQGKNLFHLLPAVNVSSFMKPFWDEFWNSQNSGLLTIALIINEQNYIEKRVVQNPTFKKEVFNTIEFTAQSVLQLTQVLFPYFTSRRPSILTDTRRLAGLSVTDFTSLKERINVGKQLYAILFGIHNVFGGSIEFAQNNKHTGSRADYWPSIYSSNPSVHHKKFGEERLIGCKLKKNAPPFWSPTLSQAWPDQKLEDPDRFDWFNDMKLFEPIKSGVVVPSSFDMTKEFCSGLNRLELAVLASQTFLKK